MAGGLARLGTVVGEVREEHPDAVVVAPLRVPTTVRTAKVAAAALKAMNVEVVALDRALPTQEDAPANALAEAGLPVLQPVVAEAGARGDVAEHVVMVERGRRGIRFISVDGSECATSSPILRPIDKGGGGNRPTIAVTWCGMQGSRAMAEAGWLEAGAAILAVGGASGEAEPELVAGTLMVPGSAKASEVWVTALLGSKGAFAGGSTSRLPVPADGQPDWAVHDVVAKALSLAPTAVPTDRGAPRMSGADVGFGLAHECGACHEGIYGAWREHPHGQAMAALRDEGKAEDESCLTCHSEYFRRTGNTPPDGLRSEGVQCAACHGDSLLHGLTGRSDLVDPVTAACIACHTEERSPKFGPGAYRERLSH